MDRSYSFEALLTVLLAGVLLFAPAGLYGQSLYEQAPTISGGLFSNAGGLIAADQFVPKETAEITAVRWCGFFQDASIVLLDSGPAEFRFRIRFFEDGSGVPGPEITQQDVTARVRNTGVRTRFDKGPVVYEFTAASLQPVTVNQGATVWISISAVEAPALWLWTRSIASLTDTLAVKDEGRNQREPLDWQSNGKFGQLAFTLFTGSIGDLPLSLPEPPSRPRLRAEIDGQPLTSGSNFRPPRVAARSEPQYTNFAARARVNGTVVMDSLVSKDGSLSILSIVEGVGFGLDEAAQSALQQWRFNPGMRDGKPQDVRLYIEVQLNIH